MRVRHPSRILVEFRTVPGDNSNPQRVADPLGDLPLGGKDVGQFPIGVTGSQILLRVRVDKAGGAGRLSALSLI